MAQTFAPETLVGFQVKTWGGIKITKVGIVISQSPDQRHTTIRLPSVGVERTIETHRLYEIKKPPPPAPPKR